MPFAFSNEFRVQIHGRRVGDLKPRRLRLVFGLGAMCWAIAATPMGSAHAAQSPAPESKPTSAARNTGQVSASPAVSPAPAASPTPASLASKSDVRVYSVTRAVGEVGSHIVTSREVRAYEAVQVVIQETPSDEPAGSLALSQVADPGFPAAITRVLDEWTVVLSVRDLGVAQPDSAEVDRLVKATQSKWKGVPDFIELELTNGELRAIVERQLLAQSVLRLKSDETLVTISDAEALQHFRKNRVSYGDRTFEEMRDNIKARLAKVQTERRLIEWRQSLRRRYKVRNFFGT